MVEVELERGEAQGCCSWLVDQLVPSLYDNFCVQPASKRYDRRANPRPGQVPGCMPCHCQGDKKKERPREKEKSLSRL